MISSRTGTDLEIGCVHKREKIPEAGGYIYISTNTRCIRVQNAGVSDNG